MRVRRSLRFFFRHLGCFLIGQMASGLSAAVIMVLADKLFDSPAPIALVLSVGLIVLIFTWVQVNKLLKNGGDQKQSDSAETASVHSVNVNE